MTVKTYHKERLISPLTGERYIAVFEVDEDNVEQYRIVRVGDESRELVGELEQRVRDTGRINGPKPKRRAAKRKAPAKKRTAKS